MNIRLAEERDLDVLAGVFSESFTKADPEKPWSKDCAYSLLSHFLKHQPDLFFVADDNGLLKGGFGVLIKPWRDGNRCTEGCLFVGSAYQKSGLGKALFITILKEALEKYDAQTFEGITFAAKQFPLTWYESIGLKADEHAVFLKGRSGEMLRSLQTS
jgi:GNAT superfamily N-acetyltransferase